MSRGGIRYTVGLAALGVFAAVVAWFAQSHRPFVGYTLGFTWAVIFSMLWLLVGIIEVMIGESSSTRGDNREVEL